MSKQRAMSNCARCYSLARLADKNSRHYETDDQLYSVKNDAMIALEGAIESIDLRYTPEQLKIGKNDGARIAANSRSLLGRALDACQKCDFKSTLIIKTIEEGKIK